MIQDVQRIVGESIACLEHEDPAGALEGIHRIMGDVFSARGETEGVVYAFPEGDRICQLAGQLELEKDSPVGAEMPPRRETPLDVYIATEVYHHGGHTPLIGDYIRNASGREACLLLTNIDNSRMKFDGALSDRCGIGADKAMICPDETIAGKLAWTIRQLREMRPDRVFLVHHQHDVIAASIVQPSLASEFYFVHHVDFNPTLGMSSPLATHIDLTPYSYHHCRMALGIRDNIYLPLQSRCEMRPENLERLEHRPELGKEHPLVTASSGAAVKFSFRSHDPIAYPEVITDLVARTAGCHVHVGKLPASCLEEIANRLWSRGLGSDSFQYVERVPALGPAMALLGIDLYVDSFPIGGAKASVDVMASGTPVLFHYSHGNSLFRETHMAYNESVTWNVREDLCSQPGQVDKDWLVRQGGHARSHFEKNHSGALIAPLFQSEGPLGGLAPPSANGISFADEIGKLYDQFYRR